MAGEEKGFRVVITIIISVAALFVSWSQVKVAKQNNRLTEAQTVGSFIPHMMDRETKAIALIAMNNYVEREVVNEIAKLLYSEKALKALAETGSDTEQEESKIALNELQDKKIQLVEQMYSDNPRESIEAYTNLTEQWEMTPDLMNKVLDVAKTKPKDVSRVQKTLSFVEQSSPETLRGYDSEVKSYIESVDSTNKEISSQIKQINRKMKARNPG